MKNAYDYFKYLFLISSVLIGLTSKTEAQVGLEDLRKVAPNVFIDCPFCDINYIRTEITFVNYVTDRYESDVHILITRQRTGSGGMEYSITYIGQRRYEGSEETLKYFSQPSETDDEQRKGLVRVLKLGLVKYISDTPLAEFISVSFNRKMKSTQVEDKWKSWAFSVGLSGNMNTEQLTKRYSYTVTLSANRVTPDIKISFWARSRYNENRFNIDDDIIKSTSEQNNFSTTVVKSINGHWSAGGYFSLYSSTYNNAKLYTSILPALEYNLFPYAESTRREFRFLYRIGYSHRDYYELTIFDKISENLFSQSLSMVLEIKEPWGNVGTELRGSHFLHDFNKHNVRLTGSFSLNIIKGLSLYFSTRFTMIHDQISLAQDEATKEETLLRIKQLATTYNFSASFGFQFRFGSVYNNVVNPRFGN